MTLDCGATASMIREDTARQLQIPIIESNHVARQADYSQLDVVGETHFILDRGPVKFSIEAVVVKNLACELLAGMPCLRRNNIVIDIPAEKIIVHGKYTISMKTPENSHLSAGTAHVIRCSEKKTMMPGECIALKTPFTSTGEVNFALEPSSSSWLKPDIITTLDGHFYVRNYLDEPVIVHKHQHLAYIRSVICAEDIVVPGYIDSMSITSENSDFNPTKAVYEEITIDPDGILDSHTRHTFLEVNRKYAAVFEK